MYNDYYDTDYDGTYEFFREYMGHITDFPMYQESIYKQAVAAYNELKGEVVLEVKEGYNDGAGGLYCYTCGDLSEFWGMFEKLEKGE